MTIRTARTGGSLAPSAGLEPTSSSLEASLRRVILHVSGISSIPKRQPISPSVSRSVIGVIRFTYRGSHGKAKPVKTALDDDPVGHRCGR